MNTYLKEPVEKYSERLKIHTINWFFLVLFFWHNRDGMVIPGGTHQAFVIQCEGCVIDMAVPAGKFKAYLGIRHCAIFSELIDLIRVNRHDMGTLVPGKSLWNPPGALNDVRHMTLDAGNSQAEMLAVLLVRFLLEVAIFTASTGGLFSLLSKLDHAFMRIMAHYTV
jgi:hypothetical protein